MGTEWKNSGKTAIYNARIAMYSHVLLFIYLPRPFSFVFIRFWIFTQDLALKVWWRLLNIYGGDWGWVVTHLGFEFKTRYLQGRDCCGHYRPTKLRRIARIRLVTISQVEFLLYIIQFYLLIRLMNTAILNLLVNLETDSTVRFTGMEWHGIASNGIGWRGWHGMGWHGMA